MMPMDPIVIVGGVRTPQGNLGGALKDFTNQKLGETEKAMVYLEKGNTLIDL